jgi:hypothetical protein
LAASSAARTVRTASSALFTERSAAALLAAALSTLEAVMPSHAESTLASSSLMAAGREGGQRGGVR